MFDVIPFNSLVYLVGTIAINLRVINFITLEKEKVRGGNTQCNQDGSLEPMESAD